MSLRSMIYKGRFYYNWDPYYLGTFDAIVHSTMRRIRSISTIAVNAQCVMSDMLPIFHLDHEAAWNRILDFAAVPKPKPPFENMWLEARIEDGCKVPQTIGALVYRQEISDIEKFLAGPGIGNDEALELVRKDKPATFMNCGLFHAVEGSAAFTGSLSYWLDTDGNFQSSFRQIPMQGEVEEKDRQRNVWLMKFRQGWILQTMARLNCNNVELRPVSQGKIRPHAPNKLVPMSVWHEIKITSVPKVRTTGRSIFKREKQEERLHWIRGHYADYRKGPGLFGNSKLRGLFWIPEYQKGDEALGQIIPEYAIQ